MKRGVIFALRAFLAIFIAGFFLIPAVSPVLSVREQASFDLDGREIIVEQQEDGTYVIERDFHYETPEFMDAEFVDTLDIWVPGINHYSIAGEPWIPSEGVSVALPPNMLPSTVSVEVVGEPIVIGLSKDLTPTSEPVPVSKTYEETYGDQSDPTKYFTKTDTYEQDALYPGRFFEYETSFGLTPYGEPGRNTLVLSDSLRSQYVDIKLFPVQYNPQGAFIEFYPDLHLKVTYDENPDYFLPRSTRAESYDMVIITPRSYVNTYEVLGNYRNTTGVITKVVAKEDIVDGKYFTASGVDTQEMIKNFLKDAIETWGIQYVLLGGDSGQIPIRYIRIDSGSFSNVPSDLYYADIYKSGAVFADWQVDGDSLWGEWTDDLADTDLRPDLILGRLPSSSTAQASNMITKIQNYEAFAYGSDWFDNITCMGLDTFSGGTPEGEYYSDYILNNYYKTSRGWTQHKLYASLGNCNSGTLLQTQNHHVGILTFSDHGLETSWAGKVSVNNVNSFTNGNKLPIVTVDACLTGAFDVSNCFAEAFLKKTTGGGIAALGSSRISLGIVGTNHVNGVSGYYNRVFHASYTENHVKQVGEMYTGAQNLYYQYQSPKSSGSDYLVLTEYCFFADPATSIGGFSKTHGKVSCGDTEKNINPGQEILYNVSIENTGTGVAFVTFLVTKQDGNPIPADWKWGLTQTDLTLSPSQNVTVFMNLTAPEDATANEVMDIRIKVLSPNIEESPLVVNTNTTVNRVFEFDLVCDDNDHTVDAEEATTYLLDIDNMGNDAFLFDLEVVGAPSDWTVQLSNSSVNVLIDDLRQVQLYVKPSAATISATYNYQVKCSFTDKPTTSISIYITTSVSPMHGFYLSVNGDSEKDVEPGDVVEFEINVENTGNHDDMVTLSFPNKNQLNGWLVKSLLGVNIDVAAFATQAITVEATVPNDATAGPVNIEIQGKLASDSSKKLTSVTADVLPMYIFYLSSDASKWIGSSGAQVPFNITISNAGNIADIYDLSIENQPTDWTVTLSNTMSLDPFETDTTNMVVTLPDEEIPAGEYNITIEASSRSSGNSEVLYLIVDIPLSLGVDLVPDKEQAEVAPGENVKFYIDVKNTGNGEDTYKITRSSVSLWTIDITKGELTVSEFSKDTLVLDVTPPANAYMGQYSIRIKAVSTTDGYIEDSIELSVFVKQTFALELKSETTTDSVKDSGEVTFKYQITNLGNGKDTFTLAFDGVPGGWDIEADKDIELDSGQNHNGKITIDVPDDKSDEKTYKFDLIATSTGDNSVSQEVEFSIDVEKSSSGGLPAINPFSKDNKGSSSSVFWLILILIIVVLVGVIIIALVVVTKRRKKKPAHSVSGATPAPVPRTAQPAKASYYKSPEAEYKKHKPEVQHAKAESAPVYSAPAAKPQNIPPPPPKAKPAAPPAAEPEQVSAPDQEPPQVAAPAEQPALPPAEEPPAPEDLHEEAPESEPEVSNDEWDDAFDLEMDTDMEEF